MTLMYVALYPRNLGLTLERRRFVTLRRAGGAAAVSLPLSLCFNFSMPGPPVLLLHCTTGHPGCGLPDPANVNVEKNYVVLATKKNSPIF